VCAAAKNRGGFTGQYEDLVEHAHVFINEIIYQLLDGFSVQPGSFCSLHTKVSERLAVNRSSELVGVIPPLAAGTYRLEVVTQFSSGSFLLKEPRSVTLPVVLTMA
jgi:hypothetical protein